ncbi:c-type cytochrome [Pelagibacterium mangrovi]|uniref:c-type cytochrome n=1 Tax=Pelagibacterium mangrovi TaxID=3119828 RepID=UPI002FC67B01
MKHIGALVGFTVLVFGTLFIFTHDWSTPTEEDVAVAEAPAPEAAPVEAAEPIPVDEALLTAGQGQYAMCQACHGPAGEGSMGPAFVANEHLADAGFVIETLLFGRNAMPAFGERYDDEEIAAIGTYIRNGWDNEFGGITVEDVAAAREAGAQ